MRRNAITDGKVCASGRRPPHASTRTLWPPRYSRPASTAVCAAGGLLALDPPMPYGAPAVLPPARHEEQHGGSLGSDARQARPDHGRRQQPLDRLGHRQGLRSAGRRTRLHLSGRCAEEARRAAGRRGRRAGRRPLRRHRRRHHRRGLRRRSSRPGARSTSWCTPSPFPTRTSSTAATSTPRATTSPGRCSISCYSFTAVAQRAEKLMTERRLAADADLLRRREMDAALQRDGRRQGGAGSLGALSRRRPRREEHPRQRHLGRPDQDAGGVRHRRLPLHPEVERATTRRCGAT